MTVAIHCMPQFFFQILTTVYWSFLCTYKSYVFPLDIPNNRKDHLSNGNKRVLTRLICYLQSTDLQIIYINIHLQKDLALNHLQRLIRHKTQPINQLSITNLDIKSRKRKLSEMSKCLIFLRIFFFSLEKYYFVPKIRKIITSYVCLSH